MSKNPLNQEITKIVEEEQGKPKYKRILTKTSLKNYIGLTHANKTYDKVKQKAISDYKTKERISSFPVKKIKYQLNKAVEEQNKKYQQEQTDINLIGDPYGMYGNDRQGIMKQERINFHGETKFLATKFVEEGKNETERFLKSYLQVKPVFKVLVTFHVTFEHTTQIDQSTGKLLTCLKYLRIGAKDNKLDLRAWRIRNENDVKEFINGNHDDAFWTYDDFEGRFLEQELKIVGSQWRIKFCTHAIIEIYPCKIQHVGSYLKSPEYFGRGTINIKNEDEECFKWCCKFHQSKKGKNDARVTALKKVKDTYNYGDLKFPIDWHDIEYFEKLNPTVGVNVFEVINMNWSNLYYSKNKTDNMMNLLIIRKGEKKHFTYIKNMSCALDQKKCFDGAKDKAGKMFCQECNTFYKKGNKHKCLFWEGKTKVTYQEKEIAFTNYKKMLDCPFVVYYDFECFLNKNDDSKKIQVHNVNSYAFKVVCSFDHKYDSELKCYVGKNPVTHFLRELRKEEDRIQLVVKTLRDRYKEHNLTPAEEKEFRKQTQCNLCKKKTDKLCRDHCHFTGKYRQALCNQCNLNFTEVKENEKDKVKIICIAHNANYDGQFILSEVRKFVKADNIKCISTSQEKFMSFGWGSYKFIDSFKFLSSSLEKLAENTFNENDKLTFKYTPYTREYFKDSLRYVCRKGVYPYEFAKCFEDFDLEGLPTEEKFFNRMKDKAISKTDYAFAKNAYEHLGCKTFKDYHEYYLKLDVLLLTDIFENFRKLCRDYYSLDPCHYVSLPSVSWDAMLLKQDELKLHHCKTLTNQEQLDFFEKQKRGGICQVGRTKFCQANNKYLDNYNKNYPSIFITYLDANSLYGWSMVQKLPYEIVGKSTKSLHDIINTPDDNEIGYTCSVDLKYPEKLHDFFMDYIPAPVNREVTLSEISEYNKDILRLNNNGVLKFPKSNKIILDLHEKKDYICDFRYLKRMINIGVEITKLNTVYEYKQDYILKDYIDFNTEKRKQAKNDFEKDFFKLLNNSIYGKMLQDILKQNDTKITADDAKAEEYFSRPNFKSGFYNSGTYFCQMDKMKVEYDRPIFVGTTILDLSKCLMLDFHYDYMKKQYGENCEVLYTDTDSLVYKVETEDLYNDMYQNRQWFDLSGVSLSQFSDKANKKVLGKMKCETAMRPIKEWIALKPKMYSFMCDMEHEIIELNENDEYVRTTEIIKMDNYKKCKGITKAVTKKLTHDDYIDVNNTNKQKTDKQMGIQAFHHVVYTTEFEKVSLSSYEDKIYRTGKNSGLPYGHYKLIK